MEGGRSLSTAARIGLHAGQPVSSEEGGMSVARVRTQRLEK
jgi:hypothetical protein